MNEPPKNPSGKANGRARFLVAIAVVAGVAVLTTIVWFSVWRWRLGRSVDAKVAAIKAAGLPVDWQGLSKWPVSVPDNENAAYIYTNAIAHLNGTDFSPYAHDVSIRAISGIDDVLYFREPLPAAMRGQFELALKTNAAALDIINRVTNASESRYPINYLDGPSADLPHLSGLITLAQLLACDAVLKLEASNAPAASGDVLSQLNLSRSLDNEPVLISQLTSAGILSRSCRTLEQVLGRAPLSEERLSQLESQFTAVEATNRFLTGLIGERAMYNEFLRLAQDDPKKMIEIASEDSSGDDQTELPRNPGAGWRFLGLFERDRDFYLGAMATNISLIQQGPPASFAMESENDRLGEEARNRLDMISALMLPTMSGIPRRDASERAELRDTITAIAIERWRLRHQGSLPDSLSDLVPMFLPAIPADPYDGKPLRYKKLKNGYCIYSIGPNLRDDGGKARLKPSAKVPFEERNNYDIVFTVER
ncbi:MAG TPA: hypothetical protein VMF08_15545 [Candidatus Sulfotelmatobacter sp.]|nr:hypothetical protein [Candidatus Sulfotelmatobacter sp.]